MNEHKEEGKTKGPKNIRKRTNYKNNSKPTPEQKKGI